MSDEKTTIEPAPESSTLREKPDSGSTSSHEAYSSIKESALIRKLDRTLLPAVTTLYLLSFLDRSNVANARVEGLVTDVHMTGNQYLTSLTLFFIGYILFEIPCNAILRMTSPRIWLPTVTLVWGIVSTLQGVTQNLAGFFLARFFLGVTEGGLFPGVVFYLSMWYKRRERQFRVALFFSAASLAGAFGGILAYGIAHMNGVGGYHGWRWIFIIEGLLTIVIAVAAYFFVYNYPDTASFLSKDEKTYIKLRLEADSDASNKEGFTWSNVWLTLKDPKVWLYSAAFHTLSLPLYTLSLFLPTIIKSLGYSAADAQLLTVPPYALATILTLTLAILSERFRTRWAFVAGSSTVGAIGYIILLANVRPTKLPGLSYFAVFLCAGGIYPSVALCLSLPAINVSGQTKRATAGALQISIGNLGAVIGTQLYRANDGPRYVVGHSVALAYMIANVFVILLIRWVLNRENKRKEALLSSATGNGVTGEFRGDEDPSWRFEI